MTTQHGLGETWAWLQTENEALRREVAQTRRLLADCYRWLSGVPQTDADREEIRALKRAVEMLP